ncbi:monocarboxylate transporter 4-like [Watersipora subatra]|uniref:monocarboxylate transporter 4-like n=1 Tax=Watersipora subatra TaxID=2589382 RepID=UPI00355C61F3
MGKEKASHSSPGIPQSQCWSYMIVIFSFLVITISCGAVYSSPIAMVVFASHLDKTYSVIEQTWLGASMLSSMSLSSIVCMPLIRLIGCRGSIILGGFVAALGPALAVFCTSLTAICLTMGVLTGIGVGLALIPALLTVELHFPRAGNKLATTLALSGIGIGVATFPPGLNWLQLNIDYMYCMLILSGTLAIISIMGALMIAPNPMKNSKLTIEIFKEEALAKPEFLAVCFVNFIWAFGSSIMYIHLPIFTMQNGHSSEGAAIMLSCIGGLSLFSRGMFRILHLGEAVTMDTVTSIFCGLCLTAIFTGLFGDISVKYTGLLGYSMLFGFYVGFWSNFINQINRETIGQDLATGGSGFAMLATSFGSLAGPPVAGFLYGETDSYKNVFYLAGGCMMFCSLLLLGVKVSSLPSARLRHEIVKKIKEGHPKEKVKEAVTKRIKLKSSSQAQRSPGETQEEANVDSNLLTNV